MNKWALSTVFLGIVGTASDAVGNELSAYSSIKSFTFSEPIAIDAILDDDWTRASFHGGSSAITFDHVEIGVKSGHWAIGVFERLDYELKAAPETMELFYLTENRRPLTPGRTFDISIDAKHARSSGTRLSYSSRAGSKVGWGAGVSYIKGIQLTDGTVSGHANALTENDYDFNFDVDYAYSQDSLFDRRGVTQPSGEGLTFDLGLTYKDHPVEVQASIVDAYGFINWNNAPFTVATATTDTKRYDENGYVIYDPVVSGIESYRDFRQSLPPKLFLASQYAIGDSAQLLLNLDGYRFHQFVTVGLGWNARMGDFGFLYNLDAQAPGFKYQAGNFRVSAVADALTLDDARLVSLSIMFNSAF